MGVMIDGRQANNSIMTIRAHDLMPSFTASGADGTPVRYDDIWQRKNLLLVSLPDDDPTAAAYARSLSVLEPDLGAYDASLIVTTTRIEGVPSPGVVVADRWGEVYYVQEADRASGLPAPDELMEWLRYVRNECPECQGEAR
jgi:hypothetical protein